jgi:hypothetical protein
MTPRDFRARFANLDAIAVEALWQVFLAADLPSRGDLVAALDRLEAAARLDLYSSRPHALA